MTLLLLACVAAPDSPPRDSPGCLDSVCDSDPGDSDSDPGDSDPGDSDSGNTETDSDSGPDSTHTPASELCAEVEAFIPDYRDNIETWAAQDALGRVEDPLLFVGSSSILRWEDLTWEYQDYPVVQRGFGGSQIGEVAYWAEALVLNNDPRAVVVYGGSNDVAAGASVEVIVDRFRCLRAQVGEGLGWDRPFFWISITPNPGNWDRWPTYELVNAAVLALEETDDFVYLDTATVFLETGSPPVSTLYDSDQIHLADEGYALWNSVIRPGVEAVVPTDPPAVGGFGSGAMLLDLGPSNAGVGTPTAEDALGRTWNNWYSVDGGVEILAGERLGGLLRTDGVPTDVSLVLAGGFYAGGFTEGGLTDPDPALLGDLAVGSATGDFFFTNGNRVPGALMFDGLDPAASYALRVFAARDTAELLVTSFRVRGVSETTQTLQVSGEGSGTGTANDDTIVTFEGVYPTPWGQIFLDVEADTGTFGYVSLVELSPE